MFMFEQTTPPVKLPLGTRARASSPVRPRAVWQSGAGKQNKKKKTSSKHQTQNVGSSPMFSLLFGGGGPYSGRPTFPV